MINDENRYIYDSSLPVRLSAGGVIVRKVNSELYLALIRDERFSDYLLPKGGVEQNEDLETAAKREIEEESGITHLTLIKELGQSGHRIVKKSIWSLTHYFLYITDQAKGMPTEKEVNFILKWFPLESLPEMYWLDQKEFIEKNREEIKRLVRLGKVRL